MCLLQVSWIFKLIVECLIFIILTYPDLPAGAIRQQGAIIFMQESISSTQAILSPIQSLSATHGPNNVAHGPFGQAPISHFPIPTSIWGKPINFTWNKTVMEFFGLGDILEIDKYMLIRKILSPTWNLSMVAYQTDEGCN